MGQYYLDHVSSLSFFLHIIFYTIFIFSVLCFNLIKFLLCSPLQRTDIKISKFKDQRKNIGSFGVNLKLNIKFACLFIFSYWRKGWIWLHSSYKKYWQWCCFGYQVRQDGNHSESGESWEFHQEFSWISITSYDLRFLGHRCIFLVQPFLIS